MIGIVLLIVAIALAALLARPAPADLSVPERLFLWLTPVPALITFVVPAALALTRPTATGRAPWADELTRAGVTLSAAFLVAAIAIGARRLRQGASLGSVAIGSVVAGLPLLIAGLIGLLYALL